MVEDYCPFSSTLVNDWFCQFVVEVRLLYGANVSGVDDLGEEGAFIGMCCIPLVHCGGSMAEAIGVDSGEYEGVPLFPLVLGNVGEVELWCLDSGESFLLFWMEWWEVEVGPS